MRIQTIYDLNNHAIQCACWDNVKTHVGTIQIIKKFNDDICNYSRLAQFLNEHGYVVVGNAQTDSGNTFDTDTENEITILQYLNQTYQKPITVVGWESGNAIAHQVMQRTKLCRAGIYMDDVARHSKYKLMMGLAMAWIGKSVFGPDARTRWTIPNQIITDDDAISYGRYLSFIRGMMRRNDMQYTDTPLLVINRIKDICGGYGKLGRELFNRYDNHNLHNLTLVLYPNVPKLFDDNVNDIKQEMLMFLNRVRA